MKPAIRALAFLCFVATAFYVRGCLNHCGWLTPASVSRVDSGWVTLQNHLQGADEWLAGPRREWTAYLIFIAAYLFAVVIAGRYPPRTMAPLAVTAGFAAGIFLLTRTCYSTDMFDYLVRGRLLVVHHANPFTVPPDAFPTDPYFSLIHWPKAVWIYGPAWLAVVSAVAALHGSILASALTLRVLMSAAYLLNGWLIWKLLDRAPAGRRAWQTALYLFCPLSLWESAINAHCDFLMLTFLLAGTLAARRDRTVTAVIWLSLAALVKAYAAAAVIFFMAGAVAHSRPGNRLRTAFAALAPAVMLVLAGYGPFVHTVSARLAPLQNAAQSLSYSWAASWVVRSRLSRTQSAALSHVGLLAAFVYGLAKSVRGREWQDATAGFFFLFCVATTWFQPWYAEMALAMAVTTDSPTLTAGAVLLGILAPISYFSGCLGWTSAINDRIYLLTQLFPLDAALLIWMLRRYRSGTPAG